MMNRILIPAVLAVAVPCVAMAQDTDTKTVPISGTVARICVLGMPSQPSIDLGSLINVSGTRIGRLAVLSPRTVTLPGSFCNFAGSALTVSATALVAADASPIQTGFARAVNYAATTSGWSGAATVATTTATEAGTSPTTTVTGTTQPSPRLADLTLTLNGYAVPSDRILVAGAYSGQVVITLAPIAVGD